MLHPVLAREREALCASLARNVNTLQAIRPELPGDGDPEVVHQFRVELRRLRTMLRELRTALPFDDAESIAEECRWLASRSSALRDLDVLLQDLPGQLEAQGMNEGPVASGLYRALRGERARERGRFRAALATKRCDRLFARLAVLAELSALSPHWESTPVAGEALRHALKRVQKQGRRAAADKLPESLHELRKRCKRLRYLLEAFAPALDAGAGRMLRRLRKLQQLLGEFQDCSTHEHTVARFMEALRESGASAEDTQLAEQRMLQEIGERAQRLRPAIEDRFVRFADARKEWRRLIETDGRVIRPFYGSNGYCHGWGEGSRIELPVGKIVCIGRNYAEHAAELGNPVPQVPLLFIKPPSAAVDMAPWLRIPEGAGAVHHELEIAILIGSELRSASAQEARSAIIGVGLAIDLTLRELQDGLKSKAHPWEIAKGFDGSAALSPFLPLDPQSDLGTMELKLVVNGRRRQFGSSAQMLTPILELLCHASRHFSLWPGDVVLTGTPKGVGPLKPGDRLGAELGGMLRIRSNVIV